MSVKEKARKYADKQFDQWPIVMDDDDVRREVEAAFLAGYRAAKREAKQ